MLSKKILFLIASVSFSMIGNAQISQSFELRYFTKDPKANGETDFKGSTTYFTTEERIEFLKHYAEFAGDFFNSPGFDHEVVTDREAQETASGIKPQPEPEFRKRIILDDWKWAGYREGMEQETKINLLKYEQSNSVTIIDGRLETSTDRNNFVWKFPGQSWRFSFSWKAKVPTSTSKASFIFSEMEKIPGTEIGFSENGMLYYTTANNKTIEISPYEPGKWYNFKIEFDLAAKKRGKDLLRFNLYVDGKKAADYVPLQRVVTEGIGYAQNFTSLAKINRLTLNATTGVQVDEILGVGYYLTERESYPYTVETFIDEDFDQKPCCTGWSSLNYNDTLWKKGVLPIVHGSERYAGEDLLLRKIVNINDFEKAYLNIETLDPGGEVWVNGKVAAVITNRTPQRINITNFLEKNSDNLLAIKVNHFYLTEKVGEIMPHSSLDFNIGWFAGKMSLDLLNYTSINNAFIYTKKINDNTAEQMLKVSIENKHWLAFRGELTAKLYLWFPEESDVVASEKSVKLQLPHNISEIDLPFTLANPKLWTPENPVLYKLHILLKDSEGNIIDDYVTTTGIRTVDQAGGSFRLNGEVSMLNGAQIMGYRGPVEDMIRESRCPPDYWVAKEILQIKKMNGNLLRVHVHNWEFPARGINDPRYAQYADQLGMMLLWCPTAWIRTGRGWGDVDFENYPKYMQQVINHPSIVMWEAANHTQSFKGRPVSESDIYCEQVYNTIYSVDPGRIISFNSHIAHLHYGNDAGTVDYKGNAIEPVWAWTAPNVTRGNQDSPTGYGKEWSALRNYPGKYRQSFLDSKERAYFNFEHQESIGQPNWDLVKGKPWYQLQSYEWSYDEGSIGRKLTVNEWKESQAWQAFAAWEAMKKMRVLDYDGFSWCCLHGGANSVTYKKPLIDFTGAAKLAWHTNKMIFQKTVAGSNNVDVVYGPEDKIEPVVLNWNNEQIVNVTVKILDPDKKEVAKKEYKNITLEGGRTVRKLDPFIPDNLNEGYYFIIYAIE